MKDTQAARRARIDAALTAAHATRTIEVGRGALARIGEVFSAHFPGRDAAVVCDVQTFDAAGRATQDALRAAGVTTHPPFIFADADLYAHHGFVDELDAWLASHQAVPLAVGSGTINDLVKLSAHHAARPYMCLATAASMDGYAAFGASIIRDGLKQTFECPAPLAIVADLDVIAAAPAELNAAGYADLLAKITAGADWILADALGIEAIDATAWQLVQGRLRESLADPRAVRRGDIDALADLTEALLMSGIAMQRTRSSRPASGAEHQFSHLWDMQRLAGHAQAPAHGFQVGIGTLAVARLYEHLLAQPLERLDVEARANDWPDEPRIAARVMELFDAPRLVRLAAKETRAKRPPFSARRHHLSRIRDAWPKLKKRLAEQLMPPSEMVQMLEEAGAPVESERIGITAQRLRASYRLAYHIRRRYTVLDLAERAGVLDTCLARIFD